MKNGGIGQILGEKLLEQGYQEDTSCLQSMIVLSARQRLPEQSN